MKERVEVDLGDVRISCVLGGEPDGPALVLVHGGACDASTWNEIVAAFEGEYRIVVPELRGHGRSQRAKEYSYELLGQDLLRLGETLDLQKATVVGHSMGGQAALLAAQKRPDWLSRLVVEDTMLLRDPIDMPPLEDRPAKPDYDWAGIMTMREQVANPDPRWWDELPRIDVPTLLLLGDTQTLRQRLAVDAAELIPVSRLRVFGCGHFVHGDKPTEYITELRDFFDGHPLGPEH